MRTDKNGTRLDIRFPSELYSELKALAAETSQPIHHISKEPTLTPLILNLIRLGIEQFRKDGFTDTVSTDKVQDKSETLSEKKINEIVDERLDKFLNSMIDSIDINLQPILDRLAKLEAISHPTVETELSEVHISEQTPTPVPEEVVATAGDNEAAQEEVVSEEVASEAVPSEGEEVATAGESADFSKGLNQADLARRLGKKSDYLTRNRDKRDFSDIDPNGLKWKYNPKKTRFFPLPSSD